MSGRLLLSCGQYHQVGICPSTAVAFLVPVDRVCPPRWPDRFLTKNPSHVSLGFVPCLARAIAHTSLICYLESTEISENMAAV